MEERTIQIQYEYDSYMKNISAMWDYTTKKNVKNILINFVLAISIMVFGVITELKDIRPIIIIMGFYYFMYMIIKCGNLYKIKKEYFRKGVNQAHELQANNEFYMYSFNDNTFEYKDEKRTYILKWELLRYYIVFKDSIMLFLEEDDKLFTSVNKSMISEDDFNYIESYLKEKLVLKK